MSDYLTRLIERSLGIAPQIEPLIPPIHAPSSLTLSETLETSSAFESSLAARIETSKEDTPRRVAADTKPLEPAFSRAESQASRTSSPLPETQPAFPIEENHRPHPIESPIIAVSRQSTSALRPEAVDITAASPNPPLSKEKTQIVVQPEIISRLKPAESPFVPALQTSSKQPPAIHVSIGRVEVRAIMPPVAAPKSTPPSASKLSLEEYLKQRNGDRS
jgi:hypothetical protein